MSDDRDARRAILELAAAWAAAPDGRIPPERQADWIRACNRAERAMWRQEGERDEHD